MAADQREAERLGAGGTPFTVLDGRYALPGAVGTDELLAAMITAWEATHPEPRPLQVLGEGHVEGACGVDGCAVPPRPAT